MEPAAGQSALIRQTVQAGRLHRPKEALREALSFGEERERRRAGSMAAVNVAKASMARGKDRVIAEESMLKLAVEVKQHGRTRLHCFTMLGRNPLVGRSPGADLGFGLPPVKIPPRPSFLQCGNQL